MYNLYSEFDIDQHKSHYVNYLEVVILEDGTIEYAVPSHQEKLIKLACDLLNISREELLQKCPKEYYFDFSTWLCKITKAIMVWNDCIMYYEISHKQYNSLRKLKLKGLYKGVIPRHE